MRLTGKKECTTLLTTIFGFLLNQSQDTKFTKEQQEPREYDVIIVGAGTAGCVVANRLSEINEWNVLLLEVGGEELEFSEIPGMQLKIRKGDQDWHYRTEPDKNACLIDKNGCIYPRGKGLGGSSATNSMLYVRGHSSDYDAWEKLGNLGWSYKDVLPYFKKSEDNKDEDILKENSKYHSTGGYLPVERFPYTTPDTKIILQGLDEIGFKNIDVNGESQLGAMNLQATTYNGSRASTNHAFLRPIRGIRSNLFIKTRAFVTKILIDPSTKKATGVEYTNTFTGKSNKVMAKKEVILSAGSIESPKLLMLSGIGPTEELERHGIKVIHNLSVGHNLQDHVSFSALIAQVGDRRLNGFNCQQELADLSNYLSTHRGPLSSIGISSLTALFQTEFEKSQNAPDLQLHFTPVGEDAVYYEQFFIWPILLIPKSIGFIKLNDIDSTWGAPILQPGYFTEDQDVKVMLQGIRKALELFDTPTFKKNNFKLNETSFPGCTEFTFNSDDYWICAVRYYTKSLFHPIGTCKMGPKEDAEAVVDSKLRVHGITNLCVIDASIMPNLIRGNTNAPVIMIAEKGSNMVKIKHGLST